MSKLRSCKRLGTVLGVAGLCALGSVGATIPRANAQPLTTVATEALALQSIIQQIDSSINGVVGNVDDSTANRLHEAQTRLDAILKNLQTVINNTNDDANNTIDNATSKLTGVIVQLHGEVAKDETITFGNLNQTLANASNMMDSVPLVHVKPFVAAVEPLEMPADAEDRTIVVHGWFPGISAKNKPTIIVDGRSASISRVDTTKIGFSIPAKETIAGKQYVSFIVKLPNNGWLAGVLGGASKAGGQFGEQIAIRKADPHKFSFHVQSSNPHRFTIVSATAPYEADASTQASQHRSHLNVVVTAPEMFRKTNQSELDVYDPDTATFISYNPKTHNYGDGPEHCELQDERATSVRITCSAPWQPFHRTGFLNTQMVWAHGTHAVIDISPKYRIRKKNVPAMVTKSLKSISMEPNAVYDIKLPGNWEVVDVKDKYNDGHTHWSQQEILTPENRKAANRYWSAEVVKTELLIQTRE